jgi:hypothetical protein
MLRRRRKRSGEEDRERSKSGCALDVADGCADGCALPVLGIVVGATGLLLARSRRARRR